MRLIIILSLVFAFNTSAQNIINSQNPVTQQDFYFKLSDGTRLDCSKFFPENPHTPRLPCVIFCHGFGGSKKDVEGYARALVDRGCITYTYSMRGQGNSTGRSYIMSRVEMNDLFELMELIKSDESVDTNNIGIIGSSQGGIIPFMAGCFGENFKFIISDLSSPSFASSWIENGCVKTTMAWSLLYDTSKVRYSNDAVVYRKWILSNRNDYRDSLENYFPKGRDFADHVKYLNSPILFSNSWQDKFFNTHGIINAVDSLNVPFTAYFGVVPGHGSDTISGETQFHSEFIDNWINYRLFGLNSGSSGDYKFVYSSSENPVNFHHWFYIRSQTNTWPPSEVNEMRLYFHSGKQLVDEKDKGGGDTVSFLNDVRDKKLTMMEALKCGFTGDDFSDKFVKTLLYFETAPLQNDVKMIGTPGLFLKYTSSADICQFNVQIWEADENGGMNFVTRINFTDWKMYSNSVKDKYVYGQTHSHIFIKGSRIRVYITNIDNGPYDDFLQTNPFVLPVLKRAKNIIYMGGDKASYIGLPVAQ
ncbi:MAG: alpha/beta fold hydrolase [Ignavibacteria bacterium]